MSDNSPIARPPHPDERALLDHLLALETPGFEELREQARHASVTSSSLWGISFHVPRDQAAAAEVPTRPVVSWAVTIAEEGSADAYLWITDDGYIDEIEIMWETETPERLPRRDELSSPMAIGKGH